MPSFMICCQEFPGNTAEKASVLNSVKPVRAQKIFLILADCAEVRRQRIKQFSVGGIDYHIIGNNEIAEPYRAAFSSGEYAAVQRFFPEERTALQIYDSQMIKLKYKQGSSIRGDSKSVGHLHPLKLDSTDISFFCINHVHSGTERCAGPGSGAFITADRGHDRSPTIFLVDYRFFFSCIGVPAQNAVSVKNKPSAVFAEQIGSIRNCGFGKHLPVFHVQQGSLLSERRSESQRLSVIAPAQGGNSVFHRLRNPQPLSGNSIKAGNRGLGNDRCYITVIRRKQVPYP